MGETGDLGVTEGVKRGETGETGDVNAFEGVESGEIGEFKIDRLVLNSEFADETNSQLRNTLTKSMIKITE